MENSVLVLGIMLMVAGVALVIAAVIRTVGHAPPLGRYELWVLPTAGLGLILLGRWLVQ